MTDTSLLAICQSGGKPLLERLDFAVFLGHLEPVFAYLVGEYRLQPTASRALGLHDVFCAAESPTRLCVTWLLPPRDFRVERAIAPIRRPRLACVDAEADPPVFQPVLIAPAKGLFDLLADAVLQLENGPIARVEREYDPSLGPHGSLPGGGLTAVQRQFVERTWKGWARPRLVAAGFWRVANVGEP